MSETQILKQIEELVYLMQVGGITWQRKADLHRLVHKLGVKPTNFLPKISEKAPEISSINPKRVKPTIPYPHWYGSDV